MTRLHAVDAFMVDSLDITLFPFVGVALIAGGRSQSEVHGP